jgi:uncharacterized protein with PIN domain
VKFLVDQPLGGLAKWLRFSGFDAEVRRLSPAALPPPAADTYLLTRRAPPARLQRPDLLVLSAAGPREQLAEVLKLLHIPPSRLKPLSRCSRCNEPLRPLPREQVRGRVPEHVFHYQSQFYECPCCQRLFWPGSHLPGLSRPLGEKPPDSAT